MQTMSEWLVVTLSVLAMCHFARGDDTPKVDPHWVERARLELRNTCEKYRTVTQRLSEESEARSSKAVGSVGKIPFRPSTARERTFRLGDNMIIDRTRILDNDTKLTQIRLECDNKDYHFTLGKTTTDSPWALVNYSPGPRKPALSQQGSGLHYDMYAHLSHCLAAVENDSDYTLQTLRFDERTRQLSVEFVSNVKNSRSEERLLIDTIPAWRVVERKVETPSVTAQDRWSYGVEIDGLSFPSEFRSDIKYKVANAPPNLEIVVN